MTVESTGSEGRTGIRLRGMTWDHRRAIDPLKATQAQFAAHHPGIEIDWSSRPLHGFEFTPVVELARSYDLIILDHPFCGEIAKSGCLLPLDDILTGELGSAAFVGPSLESYAYAGRVWALPVDAACQVAVSRPDLMVRLDAVPPRDWAGVLSLGRQAVHRGMALAIGLRGVHSLMTFFTLCANLGSPCATEPGAPLVEPDTARAALAHMRELLALCPAEALDWNSIALHDAMVARDNLVFCPAVYGYATYAESDQRRPLRFHDFPGPRGAGGSTIGGTGLGVSAHCPHPEAALAYVRFAASAAAQKAFALNHGQPARRDVWQDPAIDARFGGCFSATLGTMEACWIRPRFAGYLEFQAKAGDLIEQHLRGAIGERDLLDRLLKLFEAAPA
jgi:multiple sugar transport system substrate-binding protein